MRAKAHIGFLVGYDSINIFNIWISSQHKIVRTRDVIFNEDKQYRLNEIDAAQLISEPFLQNDTLDISQMKFNRLMIDELSSESEDDLFETPIDFIVQNNEKSEKNKEASDEIGYLSSPASTSSRDEKTPTFSSTSTFSRGEETSASSSEASASASTSRRDTQNRSFFSEEDILPEDQKRNRKPSTQRELSKSNVRREVYYIALNEVFAGDLQTFYDSFIISLTKDKRLHRDNLSPESKHYDQMLRHSEAKGFLKATEVEISTLISKRT